MVTILSDSCCDLSPALLAKYNIEVVPLYVQFEGECFRDGVDMNLTTLFETIQRSGKLPKTSAPSVADFDAFFQQADDEVFYTGIGSRLSATYQSALLAAEQYDGRPIYIVDSGNLSTGIGLLVLRAAELRDQGCSAEEIAKEIERLVPKVHSSFVIDTLEYIYMGGRCSAIENIFGSLLQIRPVIEVKPDGTLGIKDKFRGSRKKALNSLLANFEAALEEIELKRVFVTHTGCDEDAEYLVDRLGQIANIEEILVTYAGATVGSHCGPGTIGILYLKK